MAARFTSLVVGLSLSLATLAPLRAHAGDWTIVELPASSDHAFDCEVSGGVWVDVDDDGMISDGECVYENPVSGDAAWAWESFGDAGAAAVEFSASLAKALQVPVVYVVVLDRKGVVRAKFAWREGSEPPKAPNVEIGVLVIVGKVRYEATKVGSVLLDSATAPRFVPSKPGAKIKASTLARTRHRLLAITNACEVLIEVKDGVLKFKPAPCPA